MRRSTYGDSGRSVSVLGLGAGQIGDASLAENDVARLLNTALDIGVTLIDTARSYGLSEERIGRHLAHRRSEFVLSTKLGYGVPGHPDWTAAAVEAGVDAALRRLNTDFIDIIHLHSCELATLQVGDVIDALERARDKGKLASVGYSGENEALAWAIAGRRFAGVECSVNLFDQASLASVLPEAARSGIGVIAKRALGNAPWRFAERPVGDYCENYWERMQLLAYETAGLAWDEFALRFSAFQPEVSCAIVGTASVTHLLHNVTMAQKGPLPSDVVDAVRRRFVSIGSDWRGEV